MNQPSQTGLFVSFEGIDGSGKSTQLAACYQRLLAWQAANGFSGPVLQTRNPGGTPLGVPIRQLILNPPPEALAGTSMAPLCELMLYMADRAQHLAQLVEPALAQGGVVLCDRFHHSTLAYQGYGRGLDLVAIEQLNALSCQNTLPSLTFLYDGPPEVLAQRVSKRGQLDRLEQEGLRFQTRVREGFLALAQKNPDKIKVLDATLPVETLSEQTWAVLLPFLQAL